MIVLHVEKSLSERLEQRAASAGMQAEAYTHELLRQAVEEAEDLDLAVDQLEGNAKAYSTEEVRRELRLAP